MNTQRLSEAIEELTERAKVDKTLRKRGAIEVDTKAEVQVYLKLGIEDLRQLLQRRTLEIEVPNAAREGNKFRVTMVYVGRLAGSGGV